MSRETMDRINRLGFHYFTDTQHFRESDLKAWLPELQSLGAGWLVLLAPLERAIPDVFIRGLLTGGIQPILHFKSPIPSIQKSKDLDTLLETYAKWGVRYVILADRPNMHQAWSAATWAQEDLVERFLDIYLPRAGTMLQHGMTPIFPPLNPAGSYWDLTFLQSALNAIVRRGDNALLDHLVISAYAWTHGKPLSYGVGGPERWAGVHPYHTPDDEENQCGFHIFDWYQSVVRATLGKNLPLALLETGIPGDAESENVGDMSPAEHAVMNMAIAQLLAGDEVADPTANGRMLPSLPDEILCANLAYLAASEDAKKAKYAWFRPESGNLPIVGALRQWQSSHEIDYSPVATPPLPKATPTNPGRIISHYILLPSYEWGVSDWHLDVVKPFVKKYQTTIGFSIEEAKHAARVTVIGNTQSVPEEIVDSLRLAGCLVERITGDGTSIASQLSER